MTLKAFSFFHLNMAYSAIDEKDRAKVIECCYWPLLRLARKHNLPFGIEASAWTLETIRSIDPSWIAELRDLVTNGPCEFIGCGYAQVIGPLVPAEVNQENLRLGMQCYQQMLGIQPKIALVNEQAFSAGLGPLYLEAGYKGLIMEWDNPSRAHPEWNIEWGYFPQHACGPSGSFIPLIWNRSVAFQKVQRFVHGEIELDDYLEYVNSHESKGIRAFPIYGNDVEVFDFRPGRYMSEAPLNASGEWFRMEAMYEAIRKQDNIEMIAPNNVLELMQERGAGNPLHLESAACPVPVKKQRKYNIVRWALSGRNDLVINTSCWKAFEAMKTSGEAGEEDWKRLCYLWSSDFRTHITEGRWINYIKDLNQFSEHWRVKGGPDQLIQPNLEIPFLYQSRQTRTPDNNFKISKRGNFLNIEGKRFHLTLNCLRGLAVEKFIDKEISEAPLFGTLPHGYFDDIQYAADFYSGHLVFEPAGKPKITDLNAVDPAISSTRNVVVVKCNIHTPLGSIKKKWRVDEAAGSVTLTYRLNWTEMPSGSLRLGYLTLNPQLFLANELYYQCNNGGKDLETFNIEEAEFDHGAPVSSLISANQGLGLTDGKILIGDIGRVIKIELDNSQHAALGLVSHRKILYSHLSRIAFSLLENDDTSRGQKSLSHDFSICFSCSGCDFF